jgi:ABC-type multidrug transport system fused ATPase/permease subunit
MTEVDREDAISRAATFKAYFAFLRSEAKTFKWLFTEFMTDESRQHTRKMLIFMGLSSACVIALPGLVAAFFNSILSKNVTGVQVSFGLAVLCAVLQTYFNKKVGDEREWMLGLNICRLHERILELFLSKPLGQHERHGAMLNYASIDKGKWKTIGLMELMVFQGLPSCVLCAFALVGLVYLDPVFAAFAVLMSVLYAFWTLWLNYKLGHSMEPIEREFRRINRSSVERMDKNSRVISSGVVREEVQWLSAAMDANMAKDREFWLWLIGKFSLRSLCVFEVLRLSALGYGGYAVLHGHLEAGFLIPLFTWTDLLNQQLFSLSGVERLVGRDIISVQLMQEALTLKPSYDLYAGVELKRNGPLAVGIKDISYSYIDENGAEHPVLRNISLDISPGEKVALLGPSGAGKSTIMKLLLRYDDPTKGGILINRVPLKDLEHPSYMRQVGYIPQTAMIFDGTLADNLLYGSSTTRRSELLASSASELWKLMESLKINFGTRLSRGIETPVGRHGLKLSGGQAQRVMIGAAVAKQPRFMIIDEATSSLDSTTEKEVQEGLTLALSQGTTALIVAHRLSTVRKLCDRFIVLRPLEGLGEGESQVEAIADSFEELAKMSPTFRQLAADQGVHIQS